MKVSLLTYTEDPLHIIWTAARTCYSNKLPTELWDEDVSMDSFMKLLRHLYESGHHSVFEHVNFTFAVEDVTRQTTHQLVRHRHGSYSQQSMRYVNMEQATFSVPEGAECSVLDSIEEYQRLMTEEGVPAEDARRVIPIGIHTNIVVTYNLRALIDMSKERRCLYAQKEIRDVVNAMKKELAFMFPPFGKMMAIKCQRLGYCPEERNSDGSFCSIRPPKNTIQLKILEI